MNTDEYDLSDRQEERIEHIEQLLADLDRREAELLDELGAVLDGAPEQATP